MAIPFPPTLRFDDLAVLLLVENGGASPPELEETLGIVRQDTKALFCGLVHRSLLDWQGRPHAHVALPWPWSVGSTIVPHSVGPQSGRR